VKVEGVWPGFNFGGGAEEMERRLTRLKAQMGGKEELWAHCLVPTAREDVEVNILFSFSFFFFLFIFFCGAVVAVVDGFAAAVCVAGLLGSASGRRSGRMV
jgi:hypothetical protein